MKDAADVLVGLHTHANQSLDIAIGFMDLRLGSQALELIAPIAIPGSRFRVLDGNTESRGILFPADQERHQKLTTLTRGFSISNRYGSLLRFESEAFGLLEFSSLEGITRLTKDAPG